MTMMNMDRRALLQRALVLAGAAVLPGGAEALAAAAKSGKHQLDAQHYALLTAVADTILPKTDTPGAVEAGVPQLVDALLGTWASPESRVEIIAALDKIDGLAKAKHQRPFAALTPTEREAVLTPHDAEALKPAPATALQADDPKKKPAQGSTLMQRPRFADPSYGKLKELITVGFYSSETALTHDLAYEHSPGEWQPSIPITPATRPWGGVGLF